MNLSLSAVGQAKSWSLIRKLGEGDAGEVFLVESLLERKKAILKRPRKSAFSSDIIRQATQIENEGRILRRLNGLRVLLPRNTGLPRIDIRTPELLDQSQSGTEFSERFFIVIEQATGYDLNQLERVVRFGESSLEDVPPAEATLIKSIAEAGQLPALILLRTLAGIILMFEAIHNLTRGETETAKTGIVWNDVKPDHIFWDPRSASLTVIDWGNGQFLEADGYNKERRISRIDDYAQFLGTFKTYLANTNPELLDILKWPTSPRSTISYTDLLKPIKTKLAEQLKKATSNLQTNRQAEANLVRMDRPEPDKLQELFETQQAILGSGELPDFAGADHFCIQLATRLVREGKLAEFTELSGLSCHLHAENQTKWQALVDMARIADQEVEADRETFIRAISAGLVDDWPSALWDLLSTTAGEPEPDWWDEVASLVRQTGLGISEERLPPLVVLKRNILMMQMAVQKLRDQLGIDPLGSNTPPTPANGYALMGSADQNNVGENPGDEQARISERQIRALEMMIKLLREDVAVKWEEIEPDPPDSGLAYSDIERFLPEIGAFMAEAQGPLSQALQEPKTHVNMILEAWEAREIISARRGLRQLLLWDPDRRRVLAADQAMTRAQRWLDKIRQGPQNEQAVIDFVTSLEFSGRELRNQVGPAGWLDLILGFFAQYRKGRKIGELLIEQPELSRVMPWLDALEPNRYVPSQPAQAIPLERIIASQAPEPTLIGSKEGLLGAEGDILLADPLDTWAPEARGSSARAFTGFLRNNGGQLKQAAIKIMRGERLEYALPLYREEVQILNTLRDVQGIAPLLECGFLQFFDGGQLPPDNRPTNARNLTGALLRFGTDQVSGFLSILETRAQQGWLPYIILPKLDNQVNLMWFCDAGYTHGRFLPVEQCLRLAMQICDILKIAHERNIVYRDHKLLHYYWLELYNGVFMIDWNVARYHPEGLSQAEIQFDLVQLGARALHHIFTGRVAPGALADGPNKVEEIESAANSYRTQWTYDDQRLPPSLKNILEQLLNNEYTRIARLKDDLYQVYQEIIPEPKIQEELK